MSDKVIGYYSDLTLKNSLSFSVGSTKTSKPPLLTLTNGTKRF
jgi:hypothetical protein